MRWVKGYRNRQSAQQNIKNKELLSLYVGVTMFNNIIIIIFVAAVVTIVIDPSYHRFVLLVFLHIVHHHHWRGCACCSFCDVYK
jgi:hypothetical protein